MTSAPHDPDLFATCAPKTGAIISLFGQEAPQLGFSGCRDLKNYWTALRATRLMPARSEFDPRGIEKTLASTFIAEKVAPSVARIRVAGSQVNDLLGMDVRGMPITAFFDPSSRDMLSDAVRLLFDSPQSVTVSLTSKRGFARKPLNARMILLPMSDATGQCTRVVGCLEIAGDQASLPRRFQVTQVSSERLTGSAPQPEQPAQPTYVQRSAEMDERRAFAESPVPFVSSRATRSQKAAHLRLVVANE